MNVRFALSMWGLAGALFAGFFTYYFQHTDHLSFNGGPDEEPHYHAARFIDEHRRLAVYPDDEAHLYFSRHGTTRSFRPPLTYLTGVGAADLLDALGIRERVRYRVGSAILGALTVSLIFLAVVVFSDAIWVGLFSAICFGLLPQFTFLAAYFNDDVGAVMSVALLLYSLVLILRGGVCFRHLVLVGVAAGLIVISKPSAWAVAAGLLLSLPWLLVRDGAGLGRSLLTVAAVASAVGGWWILFNLYQHGLYDPLNWEVERELGRKYRDLPPGVGLSYAAQGVGLLQLLTNYDDFLTKTYKSAIGNLDWLRLEMGARQYGFYGGLLLLAGVGGVWTWTSPRVEPTLPRTLLVIFLIAMGLQIAAYFWVNLHRDSQAQGRYLLPAAPIVILLLASALRRLSRARSARLVGNRVGGGMLAVLGFCGLLAVPVYVHLNGFVHYVLPFYKPDYYHRLDAESFSPLPKGWHDVVLTNRLQLSDLRQPSVLVKSSGNDPWLMLDREHSVLFAHGVLVRVTLESQANGTFSVYWDEGMGMNEALSARRHFNIGYQTIYLPLATDDPEVIRLDPLIGAGNLIIHEIAVARLEREPLTVLRFLRQWLGFAEADVTAWQRGS